MGWFVSICRAKKRRKEQTADAERLLQSLAEAMGKSKSKSKSGDVTGVVREVWLNLNGPRRRRATSGRTFVELLAYYSVTDVRYYYPSTRAASQRGGLTLT